MATRASFATAENNRRQSPSVQPSPTPSAPISHPAGTKRKRSQDSEAEATDPEGLRPSKYPQRLSSLEHELSEKLQEDSVAEADKPECVSHSEDPQELPPQTRPVQPSPTPPAPFSQPAGTKRKRSQDSEAEAEADELEDARSSRQPRELPPPKHELSEKNLRLYNQTMDDAVNSSRPGSIKRSSSQRSLSRRSYTASDGTQGTKGSSSTNAHYRFKLLRPALINVHADPPPKDIQAAINAIVKAKPPKGRREQLEPICQVFQACCAERARASVGENDFVKIFHDALDSMNFNNLCLRTNADWQEQLKPKIQHSRFNVGSLRSKAGCQQQQIDDASAPPPAKRQQQIAGQAYISPEPSMANGSDPPPANGPQESNKMPPPATIPEKEGTIKTPRPDISMGILLRALASALSSQDLDEVEAELFLGDLQSEKESREPDGPEEPMLISVPAPRASDLAFPFAVLEGKAYLTGKQISEAENQAAVSGACALKMQLRLDELVKRATAKTTKDLPPTSSAKGQFPTLLPPSEDQIPLFFSICTEGPIHQLFVHWTEVQHGKRQFNMTILKCVHGLLPDDLEDFFVKVDNVLRWGTEHFLESLVMRLGKVARNTGEEA